MDDGGRRGGPPEDDHVSVVPVRRVPGHPPLDVRDDSGSAGHRLLEDHVPGVDHAELGLGVAVRHGRALHDDEGRPDPRVHVKASEEHGDDDAGDDRVLGEIPPKVFGLVVLAVLPLPSHVVGSQGAARLETRAGPYTSKVDISRRTGYATLWTGTGTATSAKSSRRFRVGRSSAGVSICGWCGLMLE